MSKRTFPTIALAAVLFTACSKGDRAPESAPPDTAAPVESAPAIAPDTVAASYATDLGVDLSAMQKTGGGLYYEMKKPGKGATAEPGDMVTVHYTGWLPDGTKFDSSRDRGEPFSFRLGQGTVIEGWEKGVTGMKAGERRLLVIPPSMGYGVEGAGGIIPPNATLVFDVELLEVQ